ncbi:MAG: rod shape-determining protein MreC, partial [Acidimicrobiales bacterium]
GRLDRVDSDTATVELISSPDLAIGVRLASTGDIGLGRGDPEDPSRFVIDRGIRFPLDPTEPGALPEIGSSVVTSAESRYPADVPVGVVLDVGRDEVDGLTMVVDVEVVVDVDELAFVSVLMTAPDDDSPGVDGLPGIEDPPGVGPDGEGSP